LNSLDCKPELLIRLTTPTTSIPIPGVFGYPESVPFKQTLGSILNGEISETKAYRARMALVAHLLLTNENFLNALSLEELEKLDRIVSIQYDTFREKSPSFFDYKGISLTRQSVAGVFSINTARVLSKQERVGRVLRKK
jgi:hypothetical protein